MRKVLRILAVVILLGAGGFWLATGANRGWTQTSEEVRIPDPVTGLDRHEWKSTFVPGKDFLGASVVVAGILAGASFLFRNKKTGN